MPMQNYFRTICQAVADKDEEVRKMALVEVRSNFRIGPIVEWFYWFGFFLLRKDTTSICLPLWGLDLIEALEMNQIGPMSATELQVRMSIRKKVMIKTFSSLWTDCEDLYCLGINFDPHEVVF